MPKQPWYTQFDTLYGRVDEKKKRFDGRCQQLGVNTQDVYGEIYRDLITRIVHESNWQEELYLGIGQTKELANMAFDDAVYIRGPHLDVNKISKSHRDEVIELKRMGATAEQIAAYNLSVGHMAMSWISFELRSRLAAGLIHVVNDFAKKVKTIKDQHSSLRPLDASAITRVVAMCEELRTNSSPLSFPLNTTMATLGDMMEQLLQVDFEHMLHPMKIEYIHLLHRLTTMGLIHTLRCGRFRHKLVHITGNPVLVFPPPSLVPALMAEYCKAFPSPLTCPGDKLILLAAEYSHRFVKSHPYSDGNGRVSRLLMNLILSLMYPPVYLKADKKGRHRYSQALRRADRGNVKPLACLILMALDSIYDALLAAVYYRKSKENGEQPPSENGKE